MNPHYAQVARRAAHRCEYCQAPEAVFNFPFEVEHIIPPRLGGTGDESNLALSCRSCNLFKSDYLTAIDPLTRTTLPLFHPRQNRWAENFVFDETSGVLTGLTETGRATVERLQMNRPTQLIARQHWMLLKLFPG